ncbi:cathepsin L-like proteinase [Sitophilus oryzae]|uniref:Cathepsin L-like proteinase n=1 Tax=Sitophilus oryzae TaxID=7048 RepID=A0A6J2Y201_SITOR|nr:cathepsin L-like proteinase [Sitophilus oryzae]
MMSKIIILFAIGLVVNVFGDDYEWSEYKKHFHKRYGYTENNKRRAIFENNLEKIKENNNNYNLGLVSYKLAINKFTDKSPNEISAKYYTGLGNKKLSGKRKRDASYNSFNGFENGIDDSSNVPESIDWRAKGAVTDIKDQGECGSCWSFGATGVIEGQMAIHYGILESLSAQQLIDCVYCSGCDGGNVDDAFDYVMDYGLMTSEDYPYEGVNGECKDSSDKSNRAFIDGYDFVKTNSEEALRSAVGLIGPISVAIQPEAIMNYEKGIFDGACTGNLSHVVLIVGYDKLVADGTSYWIIKNSWGTDWGENGYMRLRMGKNLCGITTEPPNYAKIFNPKRYNNITNKRSTLGSILKEKATLKSDQPITANDLNNIISGTNNIINIGNIYLIMIFSLLHLVVFVAIIGGIIFYVWRRFYPMNYPQGNAIPLQNLNPANLRD